MNTGLDTFLTRDRAVPPYACLKGATTAMGAIGALEGSCHDESNQWVRPPDLQSAEPIHPPCGAAPATESAAANADPAIDAGLPVDFRLPCAAAIRATEQPTEPGPRPLRPTVSRARSRCAKPGKPLKGRCRVCSGAAVLPPGTRSRRVIRPTCPLPLPRRRGGPPIQRGPSAHCRQRGSRTSECGCNRPDGSCSARRVHRTA